MMEYIILAMLWFLLLWHALAKLWMHTEVTVCILKGTTTQLGKTVQKFEHKCTPLDTQELPKETATWGRWNAAKTKTQNNETTQQILKKTKKLNLKTFKWHNFGIM